MWSKIVFWLRLGAAIFAGVAAVFGVYNHYAPDEGKLPDWFEPTTWGIALAIVMFDNVGTLISRKVRSFRSGRKAAIEKALLGMIINLAKTHSIPFDEIGASVYVPYWRDTVRRPALNKYRLKRIVRFRPAGYPLQSGVKWSAGKGMVGHSWETRSSRYLNTHAIAKSYGGQDLTQAQFMRLSKDTRCGFTVEEFNVIAGKYSEVRAEPLWHGRKERSLVGAISIDRAYIAEDDRFSPKLDKKETREVAAAAASVVSDILKPRVEEA